MPTCPLVFGRVYNCVQLPHSEPKEPFNYDVRYEGEVSGKKYLNVEDFRCIKFEQRGKRSFIFADIRSAWRLPKGELWHPSFIDLGELPQ